ncbi:MAG: GH36-type glycosyl hydrolase domain-containing protein [Promethearchaeota archaeon]
MEKTKFGRWVMDKQGLPRFEYTCKEYSGGIAEYFTTSGHSNEHYHYFGNDCWGALATNHGHVHVLDSRRGFVLVGKPIKPVDGSHAGFGQVLIKDSKGACFIDVNTTKHQPLDVRVFGPGYIKKGFSMEDVKVENLVSIPQGDDAVILSEITLRNEGDVPVDLHVSSLWNIVLTPLPKSLIVNLGRRKHYSIKKGLNFLLRIALSLQKAFHMDTTGARLRKANQVKFTVVRTEPGRVIIQPRHKNINKHDVNVPSGTNFHFYPMYVASLQEGAVKMSLLETDRKNFNDKKGGETAPVVETTFQNGTRVLGLSWNMRLEPGTERTERVLMGSCKLQDIEGMIEKYSRTCRQRLSPGSSTRSFIDLDADHFTSTLLSFSMTSKPWMARETRWHSAYFLGMMFWDDYFKTHRIPQGSVYLFGHGFDGAVRDFCLFFFPLIFLDPVRAKEFLKFILSLVDPEGRIPYGLHGHGMRLQIPLVHSNPSDQYFFVLWAVIEYVFILRDESILDEEIVYRGRDGSLLARPAMEVLEVLVNFVLSDEIGFGPHDLIRVKDGDWNDGITLMAGNRRKFVKDGESTFNSAMLLYTFSKLVDLVSTKNEVMGDRMREAHGKVKDAIEGAWNGKWYYRGFDGRGNPLGDGTIFLDHHAWILVNEGISRERQEILWGNIENKLIKTCSIGAKIMDPPNPNSSILPPGWDVNGGTWHAINNLLSWGLRKHDWKKSLEFFEKMSMHNRSKQFPTTWYGIWSGPDSYNADDAERPGEAFYHVATPMCDFPFLNNNLHAGILSAAIRMAGIQGDRHAIKIGLDNEMSFTFRSVVIGIKKDPENIEIILGPYFKSKFLLEITLPWSIENINLVFDDGITRAAKTGDGYKNVVRLECDATGKKKVVISRK